MSTLTATSADAATIPTVTCTTDPVIFNTGYNSSTGGQTGNGAEDERWTVAGGYTGLNYVNTTTPPTGPSPAALPSAGTTYAAAYSGKANNAWADSQSGKSQWITANYTDPNTTNGQNQATGYGDWYYRYQFNLDPAVDPATFQLDMSWLADNSVNGVWVNNVPQSGSNLPQEPNNPYLGGGFLQGNAASTSISGAWQTGLNTILVQVKSFYLAEGFDAEVTSKALCPSYTVSKSASAAVAHPGQKLTYTVTLKNTSGAAYSAANPASFTDDLSKVLDDATYNGDASDGATVTGNTLSWSGPLAAGATQTITYSVTVGSTDPGDGVMTNAVTPTGNGGTCDPDASCTTTTPVQSYAVTKTADRMTVVPGQKITYTVTVKNTGTADYTAAAPASFTDNFAAVLDDATYDDDASNGATYNEPTLSWSGPLAVDATETITYSVTVNDPDTGNSQLDNTVVTPPGNGGDCDTDSGNPACTVNIPSGSYTLAKTSSTKTVTAGDTVTYTVTVKNTGQVEYTQSSPASFTDNLARVLDDAKVTVVPDNGATIDGSTLSWSGPLAIGATETITYTVTVNSPDTGDSVLTNAVQPTGPGGSCDPNGDCSTTTSVRAFTIAKTSSPTGTVHEGDKVTYVVTVKNTGTADFTASNPASFTDDLSKVLDDAKVTDGPDQGATIDGDTLSWSGALATGDTVRVTYVVTVNTPDTGDKTLSNAAVAGDGGSCATDGGCQTTNNVGSYKVTKTVDKEHAAEGDKVTYTVTVQNTGAAAYTDASPATFKDNMSNVLDDATYNNDATNGATFAGKTLSWSGPLAVGRTVKVTYSVTVNTPDTGDRNLHNVVIPGDPNACASSGSCETNTTVPGVPPAGPLVATGGTMITGSPAWPWIGTGALALAGMVTLGMMAQRRRHRGDAGDAGAQELI